MGLLTKKGWCTVGFPLRWLGGCDYLCRFTKPSRNTNRPRKLRHRASVFTTVDPFRKLSLEPVSLRQAPPTPRALHVARFEKTSMFVVETVNRMFGDRMKTPMTTSISRLTRFTTRNWFTVDRLCAAAQLNSDRVVKLVVAVMNAAVTDMFAQCRKT